MQNFNKSPALVSLKADVQVLPTEEEKKFANGDATEIYKSESNHFKSRSS